MKIARWFLLCVGLLGASPALAARYVVTAKGRVQSIATVNNGVVNLHPALSGNLVSIGDAIDFHFTIDTKGLSPASLFDADPTINIYDFSSASLGLKMGSYDYRQGDTGPSSVQLWNNHLVGRDAVDSQSFSVFDYRVGAQKNLYPFVIGTGEISESLNINLFDFSATARSSDSIAQIVDPQRFGSKSFSYGLLNSTTNMFYNVTSNDMAVTISPVPEPAAWVMMIVGFGMVGGSLRRRQRGATTTFA